MTIIKYRIYLCTVAWVLTARLTSPEIKTLKRSLTQQVFLFNGKR